MPVILTKENGIKWLDSNEDISSLKTLLQPYSSENMQFYEVPSCVNSWKNDTPECIQNIRSNKI